MERESMVINGRLHIQGEDGYYHRVPLGMDEARSKEEHPVYRLEDGKPVEVKDNEELTLTDDDLKGLDGLSEEMGKWASCFPSFAWSIMCALHWNRFPASGAS